MRYLAALVIACFACFACFACNFTPAPRRGSAPCSEVAAHDLALLGLPLDHKVLISSVCHDDRWPIDVRRCILAATARDALDGCHAMLEPKQLDGYREALAEVTGSGS